MQFVVVRTLWAQAGGRRPSTAGSNPARVAAFPFSDVLALLCLACQTSLYFVRPCGLMDKALVFGTKDCRFESCQGHPLVIVWSKPHLAQWASDESPSGDGGIRVWDTSASLAAWRHGRGKHCTSQRLRSRGQGLPPVRGTCLKRPRGGAQNGHTGD